MKKRNVKLISALDSVGWTQGELVRRANLKSETWLSRVINGYEEPNDFEKLKIANALGECTAAVGLDEMGGE
jgi:hypothetical protein